MTKKRLHLRNVPGKLPSRPRRSREYPLLAESRILGNSWGLLKTIAEIVSVGATVGAVIASVAGWVPKGAVPVLLAAVGLVCVLYLLRLRRGRHTRAWSLLDIGKDEGELFQFCFDESGAIVPRKVPRSKLAKAQFDPRRTMPENSCSLALAADATVLASLAEHTLTLSTVNPRTGTAKRWGESIPIDKTWENPRVVSVAGKGDHDVWLALVRSDDETDQRGLLLRASYSDLRKSERAWDTLGESPNFCQATHAAFLGNILVFDTDTIRQRLPNGILDRALDGKKVVAVDAAKVGGRTYLAVLAEDDGAGSTPRNGEFQLIVVPVDGSKPPYVREFHTRPTHVGVVRIPNAPGVSAESVCVLVDTEKAPIFPFRAPVTGSGWDTVTGSRWFPWARRRKPGAKAAAAGGST